MVRSGRRPTWASARRSQGPPSSLEASSASICAPSGEERAAASRENLDSWPYRGPPYEDESRSVEGGGGEWVDAGRLSERMDAHDELFYRLNDPDPHTQVMAELDLLYDARRYFR